MADQITISVPEITGVLLTPNPANTGVNLALTVTVVEKTVVLTPFPFNSGETYSGES